MTALTLYRCPQCGVLVTDDDDPRHTCSSTVGPKPSKVTP